jgi:hypothetical protein
MVYHQQQRLRNSTAFGPMLLQRYVALVVLQALLLKYVLSQKLLAVPPQRNY